MSFDIHTLVKLGSIQRDHAMLGRKEGIRKVAWGSNDTRGKGEEKKGKR